MQSGGAKNPPWARSNVNTNMTGMNPQIMDPNAMMTQQGMMQFQQTQAVFNPNMMQTQGGMAMPMTGQMPMNQMAQGQMYPGNVVAYPTPRAMNPNLYQNTSQSQSQPNSEQRVFTGTVTKTHNDFGFVDHDVFYQISVCTKGVIPKVNDRVLVEATFNPNMPFKWNATRVQVLPKGGPNQKGNMQKSNTYNAVPPPSHKKPLQRGREERRDDRGPRRDDRKRSRTRTRSRSRERRDSRNRRDSPPRKRPIIQQPSPVKYVVRVPRMPLDIKNMDVPGLSQRYSNLYIPSDFFNANVKWGEVFPPESPFSINNPCAYQIMSRDVENPYGNDATLEPPDADYRFSAKVMLISMPTLESLYQKCGLTKVDEKDKRTLKSPLHPTRLIKFLVGQRGKGGENFAIGGPWSPSLDGENPQSDPGVLVKTAIRTCKALTGIDLSKCSQWYRMVEFYYWRECSSGKSRLECVVLFLPDVWSAQPSRVEWTSVQDHYKAACDAALKKLDGEDTQSGDVEAKPAPATAVAAAAATESQVATEKSQIKCDLNEGTITIDENDDDDEGRPEPTHYSKIDLRTIKVDQLREELRARNVSCKGVRAQLISRLSKLLKAEQRKESNGVEVMEVEDEEPEEKKDNIEEEIVIKDDDDDDVENPNTQQESNPSQDNEEKSIDNDTNAEKKDEDEEKKVEEELEVAEKIEDVEKEDENQKMEEEVVQDDKKEEKQEEKTKDEIPKTEKEIEEEKKKLEKAKQNLKSLYQISSVPHIMVHPSPTAKGGKFICNVATLSLLLDYRITDNKEHSFELFVFAELFNEMLMRDFGFYIYKTLYTLPEKAEEVKEKKDEKKDEKDKKDEKKDDKDKKDEKKEDKDKKDEKKDDKDRKEDVKKEEKRDDRRDSRRRDRQESHSDDERSGSPRRRGRGVELPPDPYLLLSLVYFDTSRGGNISKKDLQNLFMSLGLRLSRSQIRVVLEKVCVKDNFSYKTLMQTIKDLAAGTPDAMQDMPLDTVTVNNDVPPHIAELEATIAAGNRELLPLFKQSSDEKEGGPPSTKDISDTGMVTWQSRVIDVGALVASASRAAERRARLEAALETSQQQLRAARAAAAHTQQAERGALHQLAELAARLAAARARVSSLTASSKIFHSALKSIQSKVEAVVNIKYEDDDVVEIINGPVTNDKPDEKESSELDKKEIIDVSCESPETVSSSAHDSKDGKETNEKDNTDTEYMELDDKE